MKNDAIFVLHPLIINIWEVGLIRCYYCWWNRKIKWTLTRHNLLSLLVSITNCQFTVKQRWIHIYCSFFSVNEAQFLLWWCNIPECSGHTLQYDHIHNQWFSFEIFLLDSFENSHFGRKFHLIYILYFSSFDVHSLVNRSLSISSQTLLFLSSQHSFQ